MAIFASFSASRVQHISDLHSKFALGHITCESMVDIQWGPSVNKESLSEIPFYSMFHKLPVTRKLVLCIVYGCNHNSSRESCKFYRFPANKRTNWGELSR